MYSFLKYAILAYSVVLMSACGGASSNDFEGGTPEGDPLSDSPKPPEPISDDSAKPDNADNSGDDPGGSADNNADGESSDQSFYIHMRSPAVNADSRALISHVIIEFNKPLIEASVSDKSIYIRELETGKPVRATLKYQAGEAKVELLPERLFTPETTYLVSVTEDLMAEDGEAFSAAAWHFTTVPNLGETSQSVIDSCMSDEDIAMLAAVNNERIVAQTCSGTGSRQVATHTLKYNCIIAEAALAHSTDMATHNFFAHTGSDGSSSSERVTEAGYSWRAVGENIAAGHKSVRSAVDDLMDSTDGHCENIMNPSYLEFGHSVVRNSATRYGIYWTQNFAAPF